MAKKVKLVCESCGNAVEAAEGEKKMCCGMQMKQKREQKGK